MATGTSFTQEEQLPFQMVPLGDSAIVLHFDNFISPAINRKITIFASCLEENPFPGMVELVPAYNTLTIYYNPWVLSEGGKISPYSILQEHLKKVAAKATGIRKKQQDRLVEIPVCYTGIYSPDLEEVVQRSGLSAEEVIDIHAAPEYLVYMMGFVPGFPYLGGMDPRIQTPRKAVPRQKIPAGSVGIAGKQTGVYPLETPGGWQLIGRTPLILFDPGRKSPSLLQAGDKVRFVPVTEKEFMERKAAENGS